MTTVFFGGSRKLTRLNTQLRERISNILSKNYCVLVGDANGADKAVQQFLAQTNYRNVLVYCMEGRCRNNIGNWQVRSVDARRSEKGFSYYALKDEEMSRNANYGFMVWDGKSKGTLNNILNLVQQRKPALVYFSPSKNFFTVKCQSDIEELIESCDPESVREFERVLKLSERAGLLQNSLTFA
jgi:hypothetical protein